MKLVDTLGINPEYLKGLDKKNDPQQVAAWMFELDKVETWAYWDNVFSPQECERIITLGNSLTMSTGAVRTRSDSVLSVEDSNIRNSTISWIYPSDGTAWIFERLASVIVSLNKIGRAHV